MKERWYRIVFVGALLLALFAAICIGGANLWFGNLNQDEGWYLYAARSVSQGRMPYLDFFFTQSPLLPCIYGILHPLWAPFGVAGGRLLTLVFGICGSLLAAWAAATLLPRRVRFHAAVTVFALLSCNVYHSYFTTIVKTYGLACCLMSAAALALSGIRGRTPAISAALCGFLLACAAGTRLSLGLALCVVGVYLLGLCRRKAQRWCWLWFGIGGISGLAVIFLPFVIPAFEQYRFALSFHGAREGGGVDLLYVAGFCARWASGYLVLFALGIALVALRFSSGGAERERVAVWPAWLAVAISISLVHMFSPYPYDDYQVPVMPLFAASFAVLLWRRLDSKLHVKGHSWVVASLVVTVCVVSVASPVVQDWVLLRQDRFWVVKKEESALARLRRVGAWVAENTESSQTILTQDTYIAVEAGRNVPHGMEMGPFCYFPEMDDDRAGKLSVLNRKRMRFLLQMDESPLALVSGYGLAIASPEMTPLADEQRQLLLSELLHQYRSVGCLPDFGQGATELKLFARFDTQAAPLAGAVE